MLADVLRSVLSTCESHLFVSPPHCLVVALEKSGDCQGGRRTEARAISTSKRLRMCFLCSLILSVRYGVSIDLFEIASFRTFLMRIPLTLEAGGVAQILSVFCVHGCVG